MKKQQGFTLVEFIVAMGVTLVALTATQGSSQGAFLSLDPTLAGLGYNSNATPSGFSDTVQFLASGATQLRERFAARFQEPNLHATLLNRMVMGNVVIDHERVTRTFPEGPGKIELIAIYEVKDGRIARATFIFGPRTLDA